MRDAGLGPKVSLDGLKFSFDSTFEKRLTCDIDTNSGRRGVSLQTQRWVYAEHQCCG